MDNTQKDLVLIFTPEKKKKKDLAFHANCLWENYQIIVVS